MNERRSSSQEAGSRPSWKPLGLEMSFIYLVEVSTAFDGVEGTVSIAAGLFLERQFQSLPCACTLACLRGRVRVCLWVQKAACMKGRCHFHWVRLAGCWSAHTFRSAFPPPSVQRSLHAAVAAARHDAIISRASTNTPPTQLLRREGLLDWQLQTSVSADGFNSSCHPVKTKC